jgi:hypothetical protein
VQLRGGVVNRLPPCAANEFQRVVKHESGYPLGVLRSSFSLGAAWRCWLLDDPGYEFLGAFDSPMAAKRALFDQLGQRRWFRQISLPQRIATTTLR